MIREGNNFFLPKKVVILYTEAKREYFNTEAEYVAESYLRDDARKIVPYFENLGFAVDTVPADDKMIDYLTKNNPLFVLNLADTIHGREDFGPGLPAVLDILGIPYLGTGTEGLIYDRNRFLSHIILEKYDISIPPYQLVEKEDFVLHDTLNFPLISKLNGIHGSIEIDESAISEDVVHLQKRVKKLMSIYHQSVIVEEYIEGKELTAMVLEDNASEDKMHVYVTEKKFTRQGKYVIDTHIGKWGDEDIFEYKKREDIKGTQFEMEIQKAFCVLKMNDYAKFDIREDVRNGKYYIIDSNANPAFGSLECNCAISNVLNLYGISFEDTLKTILNNLSYRLKTRVT
ncbi:MAG: hypothetical protein WCW16_01890 [Candidatus Magasanikbacteria bacterium]